MKKRRILIAVLAVIAVFALLLPITGLADAGNFAGDSDWGGSDWDSSWDSDLDSDWSSSGGMEFDLTDGLIIGSLFSDSPLFIIIFAIAAVIIFNRFKHSVSAGKRAAPGTYRPPQPRVNELGLEQLKAMDPDFSKEDFLENVGNMYLKLQDAWESKQWEPMRALMTESMFNQYQRQVDEYIKNGHTNHVDRIAVLASEIASFRQDEINDIITVTLHTRIVDYVTRDSDGALISGDMNREKFMTYEWTLIRTKGMKTNISAGVDLTNCPNCGAPLEVNRSGQCEYCGSVIKDDSYGWIISGIRGISQVTR